MSILRFQYQIDAVKLADKESEKFILNVGCNDDPASLKGYSEKVINCDIHSYDEIMGRENNVDKLFDCGIETWPFDDNSCSLVVFGDIVEHLSYDEIIHAFKEAGRVAEKIVITCPQDPRCEDQVIEGVPKGAVHITYTDETFLRDALSNSDLGLVELREIDYGFVPVGYLVTAVSYKNVG